MPSGRPLFDAHVRLDAVPERDLENLAFFGTTAVLTTAHDLFPGEDARSLEGHLDHLTKVLPDRLRAAGLTPHVAVGVHPRKLPWHGLEAVLSRLPDYLDRHDVVAIGEVGLHAGGEREETVFLRQVELSRALRVPLVVGLGAGTRAAMLRRILTLLREAEVEPGRVLFTGAHAEAIATIRGMGHAVTLGRLLAREAAALVARHGPEGFLLSSDLGDGPSDPVRLPRMLLEMERQGLRPAVLRRLAWENAQSFVFGG